MGIPIISVQAPWLGVMVTAFRASPLGVTVQSLWKCCASLLGKGFGPKEERKIILITCHDPSAADARHSALLWALFPLGPLAPACLPPAPVLASRLPKSCPPALGSLLLPLAPASSPPGRAGSKLPQGAHPSETWPGVPSSDQGSCGGSWCSVVVALRLEMSLAISLAYQWLAGG